MQLHAVCTRDMRADVLMAPEQVQWRFECFGSSDMMAWSGHASGL
jgi:hypothetical protein